MYDKIKVDLSKYYIQESEYQVSTIDKAYLEANELNTSIIDYIGKLFERKDWKAIREIDTRDFCSTCMIKKRPKVRHIKEVD